MEFLLPICSFHVFPSIFFFLSIFIFLFWYFFLWNFFLWNFFLWNFFSGIFFWNFFFGIFSLEFFSEIFFFGIFFWIFFSGIFSGIFFSGILFSEFFSEIFFFLMHFIVFFWIFVLFDFCLTNFSLGFPLCCSRRGWRKIGQWGAGQGADFAELQQSILWRRRQGVETEAERRFAVAFGGAKTAEGNCRAGNRHLQ